MLFPLCKIKLFFYYNYDNKILNKPRVNRLLITVRYISNIQIFFEFVLMFSATSNEWKFGSIALKKYSRVKFFCCRKFGIFSSFFLEHKQLWEKNVLSNFLFFILKIYIKHCKQLFNAIKTLAYFVKNGFFI